MTMRGWQTYALSMALLVGAAASAQTPLPHLETRDGRHALIVDGRPFLMLAAQANNSSNYPAALPKVWPVVAQLHANTLEMPIAWEQIEPHEGQFDFRFVDTLVGEAGTHGVRLVLLWFGTWKNTNASYAPGWVRQDRHRFIRMTSPTGEPSVTLSPHGEATLAADARAFAALMRHLAVVDRDHRVVMVQVENETGVYGQKRDLSAAATRLFAEPIPGPLARRIGRGGNWTTAFGALAETAFNAWYTARYVDRVAAAGQAALALPMYANAALSDPAAPPGSGGGANGGPDLDLIDVWKAAAPHLALIAPDIYTRDPGKVAAILDRYARPDNALLVPEIGNAAEYARFFWAALGRGAIGFAPFGMDATGYVNFPLGARKLDETTISAFGRLYRLVAPQAGGWAALALAHPGWGTARGDTLASQTSVLGGWRLTVSYGQWQFGDDVPSPAPTDAPPWAEQPGGGLAALQVGPDQFVVAGSAVRLRIASTDGAPSELLRAEEGHLASDGRWIAERIWNGDQIDWGLNLVEPTMLRVTMTRIARR